MIIEISILSNYSQNIIDPKDFLGKFMIFPGAMVTLRLHPLQNLGATSFGFRLGMLTSMESTSHAN